MKILLTNEESLTYFYNALCNAVGTGYMQSYGIELTYSEDEYRLAKDKLTNPCYEDVLIQILRDNGYLTFEDIEGEGDNTKSITIDDVYEKVQLTPFAFLSDMILEKDDAITADVILQTVFYDDIIFG